MSIGTLRPPRADLKDDLRAVGEVLDEEFQDHIDRTIRHLISLGVTPDEAQERAMGQFGDAGRFRRRIVLADRAGVVRKHLGMRARTAGVVAREASAEISAHPIAASAVSIVFALLLGALGALFAIGEPLFRPLAGMDRSGDVRMVTALYRVGAATHEGYQFSQAEFEALADAGVFPAVSARTRGAVHQRLTRVGSDAAGPSGVEAAVTYVSPGYFQFAGGGATAGHLFSEREVNSSVLPVVLSHSFWVSRFDADPGIIGQVYRLEGEDVRVAGVASPTLERADLLGFDIARPFPGRGDGAGLYGITVMVRPSATPGESLNRGLTAINAVSEYRQYEGLKLTSASPRLASTASPRMIALVLVLVVLGLGLPAGLGLVREWERSGSDADEEPTVLLSGPDRRTAAAVGSALVGALIGLALAQGLAEFLRANLFASSISASRLRIGPSLGWAVFVTAAAVGLLVGRGGRSQGSPAKVTAVLACQASLVVAVLGTAILLQQNLSSLRGLFGAVDHRNVEVIKFWDTIDAAVEREPGLRERLRSEIASMPGVQSVAWARAAPMGSVYPSKVFLPGQEEALALETAGPWATYAEAAYLETMGLQVVQGHVYADDPGVEEIVVNEILASHLSRHGPVVGSCLHIGDHETSCSTVVGVVEDAPHGRRNLFVARYYRALVPSHGRALIVRDAGTDPDRGSVLADGMAVLAPGLDDVQVESLGLIVSDELALPRAVSRLAWGLAVAGLLIWSLVTYSFRDEIPAGGTWVLGTLAGAGILGTILLLGLARLLDILHTVGPPPGLPAALAVLFSSAVFLSVRSFARRSSH